MKKRLYLKHRSGYKSCVGYLLEISKHVNEENRNINLQIFNLNPTVYVWELLIFKLEMIPL